MVITNHTIPPSSLEFFLKMGFHSYLKNKSDSFPILASTFATASGAANTPGLYLANLIETKYEAII